MAIVGILVRHCLVKVLAGRTLCGDNVHDSLIGGIRIDRDGRLDISEDEKRPFISVFTDRSDKKDNSLREMGDAGLTEVVIEWGISTAMGEIDPDTGETCLVPGLAATDAALEAIVDLIEHQVMVALSGDGIWAERWKNLCAGGIARIERYRTDQSAHSARLAARQVRLTCCLVEEPVSGEFDADWLAILDDMAAGGDCDTCTTAKIVRDFLTRTVSDGKEARHRHGYSEAEWAALGHAPVDQADGSALLREVDIEAGPRD